MDSKLPGKPDTSDASIPITRDGAEVAWLYWKPEHEGELQPGNTFIAEAGWFLEFVGDSRHVRVSVGHGSDRRSPETREEALDAAETMVDRRGEGLL